MANLLFAREDILRVYRPLLKKTFLLYKIFFRVSVFPGWSFQNAKNGQNWINQLRFKRNSEVCMDTTNFQISDTLLETCNFGCIEGFFLQLIISRVLPRRKKNDILVEIWDFDPCGKIEKVKNCKNPSIRPKLCLLLAVSTIIGTYPSTSLFRIAFIVAKWAVLSYEHLKFGRNHMQCEPSLNTVKVLIM